MVTESREQSAFELLRLSLLLLVSLFFYASFGWNSLLCVLLIAGITWLGGIWMVHRGQSFLPATCTILLLLAVWLTQKWNGIFLLGISFYSLQAIGYLLDVRNGDYPAERNPFYLLLFLSFFPLSIQGPIWRYPDFRNQLSATGRSNTVETTVHPTYTFTSGGFGRILWGAFKKLVIADRIALMTSVLFSEPENYRGFYVLLALTAYTIQLYMDFTGGIDIALGTARCLGFTLPENFNHPFAARSLAEYWRRWHITLGGWFRDYVFYPLSLSGCWEKIIRFLPGQKPLDVTQARHRQSTLAVWGATLITWGLTGLWHGLKPRFLLWGLLNGLILLLGQRRKETHKRSADNSSSARPFSPACLQMLWIFLLTSLLRALDCYPDIRTAAGQTLSLFTTLPEYHGIPGLESADLLLLAVCFLLFLMARLLRRRFHFSHLTYCIGCALLLLATLLFGIYGSGYDATGFIYGNFI